MNSILDLVINSGITDRDDRYALIIDALRICESQLNNDGHDVAYSRIDAVIKAKLEQLKREAA